MQHVLVDTNVVIDLLVEREPYVREAVEIFQLLESGKVKASVCATTVTTVAR